MTNEQIDSVLDALKNRDAAVKELMEQRGKINEKLRILGVEGVPALPVKRGRPQGSKNRKTEASDAPSA